MAESKLVKMAENSLIEYIDKLVQNTPDNPRLAKAILSHLSQRFTITDTELKNSLGVSGELFDKVLNYLGECELVKLDPAEDSFEHERMWDVEKVRDVDKYLESALPYGKRTIMNVYGLSDNQLLGAMDSVTDLVEFHYTKQIKLDLTKLRKIRDESHKEFEDLREREREKIYKEFGINRRWSSSLLSFVNKVDPTQSEDGYDRDNFNFVGTFPSPSKAFKEGFYHACADFPIPKEESQGKVAMINITLDRSKGGGDNSLTLYNSLRNAAGDKSFECLEMIEKTLPKIQSRLEKSLRGLGVNPYEKM